MRRIFLNPVGIVAAIAVVGGIVLAQPLIAVAGGLVYLGSVAVAAMSQAQTRSIPHPSELSAEGRMMLRPLQQIHRELEQIVQQNPDRPDIKVVGLEALVESESIIRHAVELVQTRSQFKKSLRGKSEAQLTMNRLERDLSAARSDAERESLKKAIEATQGQIKQYERLDDSMGTISARLKEAEATLSTLKAQMIAGIASQHHTDLQSSELESMVGRLKDLNRSLDEAQTVTETQIP